MNQLEMHRVKRIVFVATKLELGELTQETIDVLNMGHTKIIETGVGKVNAAIIVTEALWKYKPEYVLNVGTAGYPDAEKRFPFSGFHIGCVEQRDMNAVPIMRSLKDDEGNLLYPDFEVKETPFEDGILIDCDYTLPYRSIGGFAQSIMKRCSTGDNTCADIEATHEKYSLVDMEAYAIVKAIIRYNSQLPKHWRTRYDIVKWVTDVANSETVGEEWDANKDSMPANEILQIAARCRIDG